MPVPEVAAPDRIAFLLLCPNGSHRRSTSGGCRQRRIGEGGTAEVLRNLCFQIYSDVDQTSWSALVTQIESLFGVTLNPPEFIRNGVRSQCPTRRLALS